jgi:hypothetical protein
MKALSQDAWVLAQLERGRSLSQNEAGNEYGVGRLASRINRLRKDHPEIKDAWVRAFNRRGQLVNIKRYWMPINKE